MNTEKNVSEAERLLVKKPLLSADAERILICYELRHKFSDEPQPIRYGKMLKELLNRVSVPLEEYDLIAGRVVSRLLNEEEEKLYASYIFEPDNPRMHTMFGVGHATLSWDFLLENGLAGLRQRALDKASACEDEEQRTFLEGAALIYEALIEYARRYAEKAREMNMPLLSRTLDACAEGAPRTFREALQLLWLVTLVDCSYLEYNPTLTLGRLDLLLYPYYRADIDAGRMNEDEARALITDYYCKHNLNMGRGEHQMGNAQNSTTFDRIYNFDAPQYMLLGGTDKQGKPASNALTALLIECINPKFKNPVAVFRYHRDFDKLFPQMWRLLMQKARASASLMFYNDDDVIEAFKRLGFPDEDARKYIHYGCNWAAPGDEGNLLWLGPKSYQMCPGLSVDEWQKKVFVTPERAMSGYGMPMDFMECARRVSQKYGDNATLEHIYEEFAGLFEMTLNARLQSMANEFALRKTHPAGAITYGDCFYRSSIENARTYGAGMKYHFDVQVIHGFATVIDCFTVTDELVFKQKKLTLARLIQAADGNFEGYEEELRLIESVPKFGSNSALSNLHANLFSSLIARTMRKCNNPYLQKYGIYIAPSIESDTRHIYTGEHATATVDGRKAGRPFSQNSRPSNGACVKGLTGMLNSMLNIEFKSFVSGALNLDIQPKSFEGEEGLKLLSSILAVYFNSGGLHAQISCVSREELIRAQKNPEEHRDLRVRVTGYTGVFVDLCEQLQNDIIERMS